MYLCISNQYIAENEKTGRTELVYYHYLNSDDSLDGMGVFLLT